jgi:hypothetical protein
MNDSNCLIRRCSIPCRIVSKIAADQFVNLNTFRGVDGRDYSIRKIVCAYNASTKDARIYMEIERVPEAVLYSYMDSIGIKSIRIDSFSQANWRSDSATALSDVRTCAGKEGFELMETGVSPAASGAQSCKGSNEAGEFICYYFQFVSFDYDIF